MKSRRREDRTTLASQAAVGAGDEHFDREWTRIADAAEIRVTLRLSDADVERIAQRTAQLLGDGIAAPGRGPSPYLTVPETAAYLRCKRQRVDDLLSQGALTRVKDGARTLIARAELEAYLRGEPTGRLGARRAA